MTSPNSREGIEEWQVRFDEQYTSMAYGEKWRPGMEFTTSMIKSFIHQELQKAREEERERIIYVTQNIKDAFMSPLTERRWLQCIQFTDQPKPKDQSELDQPDALTTLTPKT